MCADQDAMATITSVKETQSCTYQILVKPLSPSSPSQPPTRRLNDDSLQHCTPRFNTAPSS
jgi:hypothetical protein